MSYIQYPDLLRRLTIDSKDDGSHFTVTNRVEEIHSGGAIEVMNAMHQSNAHLDFGLVLDVTEEGWEDEAAFSIENDRGFDILTGYHIIQLLQSTEMPCTLIHDAEPDETWDYGQGIENIFPPLPCLSLCLPAQGELHGEEGVLIRKASTEPYQLILKELANKLIQ